MVRIPGLGSGFSHQNTPRPEESSFSNILPQVLLRNTFYLAATLTCLTVLGLVAMEWRSVKKQQQKIGCQKKGSEEMQSERWRVYSSRYDVAEQDAETAKTA